MNAPRHGQEVAKGRCDPTEAGHRWPSIWEAIGGQPCYCGLFTDQTLREFGRLATLAEAAEAIPLAA